MIKCLLAMVMSLVQGIDTTLHSSPRLLQPAFMFRAEAAFQATLPTCCIRAAPRFWLTTCVQIPAKEENDSANRRPSGASLLTRCGGAYPSLREIGQVMIVCLAALLGQARQKKRGRMRSSHWAIGGWVDKDEVGTEGRCRESPL